MRRPGGKPLGKVYRRTGRDGQPTQWWWLRYKFPGEPWVREPTSPRTADEAEAERQLHERLAERGHTRQHRRRVEYLLVNDLLDLFVLDCADRGQLIQVGRVEPWRHTLGHRLALEVTRVDLDDLCRRWRRRGPTWKAGTRIIDGIEVAWPARDPNRVRPLSGASCNRLVSVLRRAYSLGREKLQLMTPLTFPHFDEGRRGEYITEDQCLEICTNFQARFGARVKADVFRLAYLIGVRKGRLRNARKHHVRIVGDTWKLRWSKEETKGKRHAHEVVLVGEEREIVERAWANRLPDCDFLFHVDGKPLGPMRYELQRTCAALGIPYGRGTGIVFHDTRHSAVTNLVDSGSGEAAAMSITGHADPSIFKRYHVRRDAAQAEAAERRAAYLAAQRGTTPDVPSISKK